MSLKVSQGERVTVITITSNPNSKWPMLCQILGSQCSPMCAVEQLVKVKMMGFYTALGIVQIIIGVLNIVAGILVVRFGAPFCLGGVFLVVGMLSIVAAQFRSSSLLCIADKLNLLSAILAVIDLLLYSLYLGDLMSELVSYKPLLEQFPRAARDTKENQMMHEALFVTMTIFSALQLCVAISFSILTLKELFNMNSVEDPQLCKPLKEVTVSHVC
ncbi:uncharacterized protein LOC127168838 [Labeo rohita]|uniref:uncharacterized protein LOC127168838 n=1 Tax=Labeo rohita TaxID=84645 RepID=UPI0021E1D3C3|nr:uncharacterized protein LOC127168838 [Labeo rohita]